MTTRLRIYTSSFFTKVSPNVVRISVARWAPRGQRDILVLRELAPGEWFRSASVDEYAELFMAQLAALDARDTIRKIERFAAGRPAAALLCWERPSDRQFCHRGFIALWLKNELDLDILEFGRESEGAGPYHPKLPESHRLTREPPLL